MRSNPVAPVALVAFVVLLIAALTLSTGCGNASSNSGGGDNNSSASTPGNGTTETAGNAAANANGAFVHDALVNSDGICPVTGKPANADFTLLHEGKIWTFANEAARRTFLDQPEVYTALAGN